MGEPRSSWVGRKKSLLEFHRETVDPLRGQVFLEPMVLDDEGCIAVPDRPGLGFTPNYEMLESHRVGYGMMVQLGFSGVYWVRGGGAMETFVHEWEYEGRIITFSWVGNIDVPLTRVYALAFTNKGKLLLVSDFRGDGEYWLPGGGIEAGETVEAALHRELMEEAAATIHAMARIGVQRVHDPLTGSEHHGFYWCRISLADEFVPQTEVTERRLVAPDEFLDQLLWGRGDPKAAMLLERGTALNGQQS